MNRIRSRLSFANVMSVIAVFIALGGTTYAAVTLPKNSVRAKQIAKNAVGASEIKANAVRSGEVKNGALRAEDFGAGQLPQGPKGDKGDKGDTGTVGPATVVHVTATVDLADNTKASYVAFCPDGQHAISGGARGDFDQSEGTVVTSSRPAIAPTNEEAPDTGQTYTGWKATVFNPSGGITTGIRPEVWVTCVTP
jgi:hypothetical protein